MGVKNTITIKKKTKIYIYRIIVSYTYKCKINTEQFNKTKLKEVFAEALQWNKCNAIVQLIGLMV